MAKLYTGSICLTDLIEQAKKLHSSFTKSRGNGKVYASIVMWEKDEKDKFGNTHSIQLNSAKEKKDIELRCYIGNLKPVDLGNASFSAEDANSIDLVDDLPF